MLRLVLIVAIGIVAEAQTGLSESRARITMERLGCPMDFSCPGYKLTLESDGSVTFEGKQRVSARGIHRGKIQPEKVEKLANEFVAINYFDLPWHLGSCTDTPIVITSVTLGSRSHEVYNLECGNSPSLSTLEKEVDQIADSKVWIRGHLRLWLHWPWFHS